MGLIPQSIIDDILVRIDIVSVISDYVELKKAGKTFKGLCPFHQEKSPSFTVNPDKNVFHCFGCGTGGNLFSFLMKKEGLTFPEAVEKMASRAGIIIPQEESKDSSSASPVKRDNRDSLYKLNRYAAWFFSEQLKVGLGSDIAKSYLQTRGVNEPMIQTYHLGLAPNGWTGLVDFLKSKKVPLPLAEEAGLIKKRNDGSYYDFFRLRLMFPISDSLDRIIGFGGRKLDEADKESGKYINSQESPVYHKGNSIYGLFQALPFIRQKDEVVLVEGNLDVVSLFQNGIQNVVAPLGTALTINQVTTLKKYSKKFVLMFDGDAAGQKAIMRAIEIFFQLGLHPKVVSLPEKDDPDSFVRQKGGKALSELIDKAPNAIDWLMVSKLKGAVGSTQKKLEASKALLPFVQALSDPIEQKLYLTRLSQFLGMDENSLFSLAKSTNTRSPVTIENNSPGRHKISLERILLQLYVKYPYKFASIGIDETFAQFEDEKIKDFGLALLSLFPEPKESLQLNTLLGGPYPENFISELIVETGPWDDESGDVDRLISDCLSKLKRRTVEKELSLITGEIQLAELSQDKEALDLLLMKKANAIKEIKALS